MIPISAIQECSQAKILVAEKGRLVFTLQIAGVSETGEECTEEIEITAPVIQGNMVCKESQGQMLGREDPTPPPEWQGEELKKSLLVILRISKKLEKIKEDVISKEPPKLDLSEIEKKIEESVVCLKKAAVLCGIDPIQLLVYFQQTSLQKFETICLKNPPPPSQ